MLPLILLLSFCSKSSEPPSLLVFAAASTAEAMSELANRFKGEKSVEARLSFGASSDLARQIRAGAPADVFLSADTVQMEKLAQEGLVEADQRFDLLSNQLVVIVPVSSKLSLQSAADLTKAEILAFADPAAVPAGVYAKKWLQEQGIWDRIQSKVVPTLDVRGALAAVETESVSAGVVYRSDAQHSKKVRVAMEVPREAGPKITYPVAKLKRSTNIAAADFLEFLRSPAAREVFVQNGFVFLPGTH